MYIAENAVAVHIGDRGLDKIGGNEARVLRFYVELQVAECQVVDRQVADFHVAKRTKYRPYTYIAEPSNCRCYEMLTQQNVDFNKAK
jgi:hypothetical protein